MAKLPEIVGDAWFNTSTAHNTSSKPLTKKDLAGKAVLADFWTYTCVNCRRTLPYLRDWWSKYKDKKFAIIGIHTPEFEFEKDLKNVEQAIRDLGVEWPVVLDNEYVNWRNFGNRYWPAKYLADKRKNIVYTHFGEGAYGETEKKIRELVGETAQSRKDGDMSEHAHGNVCFAPTPETYCGYARGHIENKEGYRPHEAAEYQKPDKIRADSIALAGAFRATPEYVESVSAGSNFGPAHGKGGSELLLHFHATEVNLVLHPVQDRVVVHILLEGQPLGREVRGRDVSETGELAIEKPAMYNILKSNRLAQGILSVRAKKGDFRAYAFTFSGCEGT